jgi:transcriptional regulator with PAS, ATPase and Fis domain
MRRYVKMARSEKQSEIETMHFIRGNRLSKPTAYINNIFLKNITEALPQYVFWKDLKSVYLGCNKNYANFLELHSPEEIVGKTDHDLNCPAIGDTVEIFQKGDQDTIAGHLITNQEEVLSLPNGKTLITLVSKLPILDGGKVIGIVGCFADIAELKNKEKNLIRSKRQVEVVCEHKSKARNQVNNAVNRALSIKAHDAGSYNAQFNALTKREKECAFFLIRGYTHKEIAKELHIERSTVQNHIEHIKV